MSTTPQTPADQEELTGALAIIGMAGRFPGAPDVETFWDNLLAGRDTVTRFESPDRMPDQEDGFVGARGVLDEADLFDADLFGVSPRDAEQMDPQHRVFLESCFQALENAGYNSRVFPGEIGLFGGCSLNTYLLSNLCHDRASLDRLTQNYQVGEFPTALGNDKDFLTTRAAYKLDLRGPVVSVQSACATSLVALCQAAQSLQNFECDMALAGGVSITFPQQRGHVHQEGSLLSADGTCRPFDAGASGTVFGHGAGVVVLKRLEDALRDGDPIDAVLRGFAVGNDGAQKAGYMAPGVEGQARVLRAAQRMAGIAPETITYVEAHGTGTPVGDPIEMAALTQVFREATEAVGFCTVGTAKGNVGHLDAAAGITGVIKTVLSLRHRTLPGLAHFRRPNPELRLEGSPFVLSAETRPWTTAPGIPRRAGVSAFGVGGVNAHVILEEAPVRVASPPVDTEQVICLSARSRESLQELASKLAARLTTGPAPALEDVAWTLAAGRAAYPWRLSFAAHSPAQAAEKLRTAALPAEPVAKDVPRVAFLFPGQGSQFAGMGRELFSSEPAFREAVEPLLPVASQSLGLDLGALLFSGPEDATAEALERTAVAQPALFLVSFGVAHLLDAWGIRAAALCGHSLGEFVSATLAGVLSAEDAVRLVCERGRLMEGMAPGAMVSLALGEAEAAHYVQEGLDLAASNSSRSTVLAGPLPLVEQLERDLTREAVAFRRLATSHAFHSRAMEPMLDAFEQAVAAVPLCAPAQPYVSSVTGTWVTPEQCTSPRFWAEACRRPVRFAEALKTLQGAACGLFLEVGPGRALTSLARHAGAPGIATLTTDTTPRTALAQLWQAGVQPEWAALYAGQTPHRVSLPGTPLERKRFWVEPPASATQSSTPVTLTPLESRTMTPEPLSRTARISAEISSVLSELSGIPLAGQDWQTSFFELGFDSLFLTQATLSLSRRFGVKITFRQLMEQFSTVAELATHLNDTLPADALPAPAPPAAAPLQVATPAPALQLPVPATLLEQQIAQLSALFSSQVAALHAAAAGVPVPAATPVPRAVQPLAPPPPPVAEVRHGSFRPVQPRASQELTAKQQHFIDDLVARYNARTPGSKARTAQARPHLADPRAVAGFRPQWKEVVYPLLTDRAEGSRLWDVDGNEYIDIVNGYGCILFGHSPAFVVEAATEQLRRGVAIGPQSVLAGEVAELICELTGNERVTFCNTGSEAVMAALRVARTVTGRDRFVYFGGDYHGTFDEVLLRPSPRGSSPVAPGIPAENTTNVTVLEYGSEASLAWLREHAEELAAVLIEPVQTRNPANQPFDFLREVRALTERSGTAFILDEVVTGFRVGNGGMQEFLGLRADMCTYGKVLGGGHPIGVLSGKAQFLDALDGGAWRYGDSSAPEVGVTFFAGTFVRHPLALAAARSVLRFLRSAGPSLQADLNARTAALAERLDRFFVERGVGARISSFCSWFYFTFPHEARLSSLFYVAMRARGIHIQESYPCFLTIAHTEADLATIEQAFRDTVLELQAAEILPGGEPAPESAGLKLAGPEPLLSAPLTEPQREIYHAAALSDAANCAFNEALTLTLSGPVRQEALLFALDAVFARHDALRATVSEDGERLFFGDAFTGRTEVIDLSTLAAAEQEKQVADRVDAEAHTPFDLHRGPLLRCALFLLSPTRATLLLAGHHLVLDGWSANQLLEEIGTVYSRGAAGLDQLAPAMPFSTYAATEQAQAASGEFAADERFWVDRFRGLNPVLDLPLDAPRPAVKSFAGGTVSGALDADLLPALRRFSAAQGCSLFVTLLSSFQLLLHRLTGQDEVVVGTSSAAQSGLSGQSLVGHCVQFLPMLSQLSPGETVKEHLRKTRGAVLDAQDHVHFTLGSLVHALTSLGTLERHPGRLPLIEVQFNLEKVGNTVRFEGLEHTIETCPKQFSNTDLFLNVIESAGGLRYTLDYNRDLFLPATLDRWLAEWEQLLRSEAGGSEQEVLRLDMLPAAERDLLLHAWNRTTHDFGPFVPVPSLILARVADHPARPAVTCYGRTWTFAELAEYSTLLAQRLVAEGVRPGDRVGISLPRSLEMPGAMLAVMLAGAAYVPLDPRQPRERLASVVADAGISLMLTGRDPSAGTGARLLDVSGPQTRQTAQLPALNPTSLAYVIYTSGSTGTPKGVAVPHSALRNLLLSMEREPGFTAGDTLAAVTTVAFDIAALEIFLPLITGGHLVMATEDEVIDGARLLTLLRESRATTLQATPGLWRILLDSGWEPGALPLKALCGGEALPRELANELLLRASSVWNMYGPTETTIWSSATPVQAGSGPLRLGTPIANTRFYVVDPLLQPVPFGVTGELAIAGDGLARGYWNRPELTADRFRTNPYGPDRLYLTGDLARRHPDGSVELLGRSDFQVKIRGFRIELGDLESALRRSPLVREAVALAKPAQPGGSASLHAFVLAGEGAPANLAEGLMQELGAHLPEYMLPASLQVVDALPRTSNGKLDRRALLLLAGNAPEAAARQHTEPETPVEEQLAALWCEVLELPRVSTTATLFELGADSLLIFRLAARAQRMGLPLKPALLFEHRTIRALAAYLQGVDAASSNPAQQVPAGAVPAGPPARIAAVSRGAYRIPSASAKKEGKL